jgi:hypothetical protein
VKHILIYYRLYFTVYDAPRRRAVYVPRTPASSLYFYITRVVLLGLEARGGDGEACILNPVAAPRPLPTVVRLGHHRRSSSTTCKHSSRTFLAATSSVTTMGFMFYTCAPRTARALAPKPWVGPSLCRVHAACAAPQLTSVITAVTSYVRRCNIFTFKL